MSCKGEIATDEYHGWECSITEGTCMYLVPNSKRCAKDYGEGTDVEDDFDEFERDEEGNIL